MVVANRSRSEVLDKPDYFELLGLERSPNLSAELIERSWKERVSAIHPDRFAAASEAQKRVAMQWSASINEAYRVIRDPLRRAIYLCELAGHDVNVDVGGGLSTAFLMQQMQWRESLDDIRSQLDKAALDCMLQEIQKQSSDYAQRIADLIESQQWEGAVQGLREWMFVDKLRDELVAMTRTIGTTD